MRCWTPAAPTKPTRLPALLIILATWSKTTKPNIILLN